MHREVVSERYLPQQELREFLYCLISTYIFSCRDLYYISQAT